MQSEKADFGELEHYLKPVESIFTGDELLEDTSEFIINNIENKRFQVGQQQRQNHQQRQQLQHQVNYDDATRLWMWNNHTTRGRNEHKSQNMINTTTNYNHFAVDSNSKSPYSNLNYSSFTPYHHSLDLSGRSPLQVTTVLSNTSNHLLQQQQHQQHQQQPSTQQPNHHSTVTLTNSKDKDVSLANNHHFKTKITTSTFTLSEAESDLLSAQPIQQQQSMQEDKSDDTLLTAYFSHDHDKHSAMIQHASPATTDENSRDSPELKRAKKTLVPDNCKDTKYWARRIKNNKAAKRSRDARKERETRITQECQMLAEANLKLKSEIVTLKKLLNDALAKQNVLQEQQQHQQR
ncbi:Transcription factor VBP [Trichoplax sp. H2]|uniref:BZIP domain-containing protein n=1 Tax=Trichoplax adhaerens TaxID=10228 RepID=B3SCC2_TRIAD|nr:hypothetical protein TRIADDRAFT_61920 [Trichoplax adhaerens]EDV19653.1 hypothetical protein TRIADDRAFT_61920 [Trichoplax adhaerens]RDD42621.1 Transcription factor VBP [Trichoplax sp. H2]|eukprot:XP_002117891.1 hypothetical protein TRIADDRAFT_61920 [Trichoplax adhaerens]